MNIRYTAFVFTLSLLPHLVQAQDPCVFEASSKVEKLLEQSKDTKKYDTKEREELLLKAVEEEANCLPCLRRLGEMNFLTAKRSGASFSESEGYFEKLIEICPEYHSEPYYFLGAMYYADHDYTKALTYFEKFLRFPDDDPTKFEKDYQKRYDEVEEAMPTVKAYQEIYADNIDFQPQKVAGVSSSDDDYLPMISPDGEIMFFTRKKYKQAKGDFEPRIQEEFTWSKRSDINQRFDDGLPLAPPFNIGDSYGGATVSVDNREMIIARKNPVPKNPENVDLFSTRYERTTDASGQWVYIWNDLQNLGPTINTDDGWEAQPSLSGDGHFLFFTAVRPECLKDKAGNFSHDIFVSERQKDGSWGQCHPLLGNINTHGQDKSPFMHSDSRTLYFASDGQIGVGGMDIFYCKMNDDGSFSSPKNIGYPINTEEDQIGIIVSSDGDAAYFGANRYLGGKGYDIFEFKMPEKAKPERVLVVKGEVKDDNGNPPQNAKVELTYAQSGTTEQVNVNADDGSYAAIVKVSKKEDVLLKVEGDGIAFNSRIVAKKEDPTPPVVVKLNMETQMIEADKAFVISDIVYATSKADIEEESKLILDEFAKYMIDHPSMVIEIRGHTDNIGNDQTNLALSMDRAFEVLNYLSAKGIDGSRMTAKGYGKTKPIAANDTEEGRAKNRRTEFFIKKM